MVGKLARRMVPAYLILLVLGFLCGRFLVLLSLIHTPIKLDHGSSSAFGLCWLSLFLYSTVDLIAYYLPGGSGRTTQRENFCPPRGATNFCMSLLVMTWGWSIGSSSNADQVCDW